MGKKVLATGDADWLGSISVPSANTRYIQEAHLAIEHILCSLVERYMFGVKDKQEERV